MKKFVECSYKTGFLLIVSIAGGMFAFMAPLAARAEMTVEEAIKLGLKNNYDIKIARITAEIAVNNQGKGTAGFLPVIDSNGNFRYDTSNDETGSPLSFGNSDTRILGSQLSLNWTLFDGFRMFANKVRYAELARLGQYQARSIIESSVVAVMRAFFNLVQQEQLLDVARTTRDISKKRLDREQVRRDLGGASSTDLLNARVNFNNDQATLLDQELRVMIAQKELNILLARDPAEPVAVKKQIIIPPFELSLDELLGLAREYNSVLLAARQNKLVAEENVRLARSAFWPRLNLNANYGYMDRSAFGGEPSGMFAPERNSYSIDTSVGLILTFNLFSGNIHKIDYQNAKLEDRSRKLALYNIENEIAGLVQEKKVTLENRIEKAGLEEQNTVTARQNLELQQDRYATGASDSLDFRDAQVNLARARVTLIVARYQARITLLEIQQLIGKIEIQ
jgi:outer membrane protein